MELIPDTASVQRLAAMGRQFPKVGDRALNKLIKSARTQVSAEIRSDLNLKKSDVDAAFNVILSRGGALVAILRAMRTRRYNLIRFGARQTKAGVTVALKKGQRQIIRGAFIPKNMRTVFKRVGKARLPIEGVKAPYSIRELFKSARMKKAIETWLPEAYARTLRQELNYFFSQKQ